MQNCICKFYRTMLAAVLILGSAAQVSAAGAPPLTRIAPIELCAEETGCIPAPEDYPNRLPEDIVFRGEHLIVRTRFIGSPAWSTIAYRSGTETGPTLGYAEVECIPLTDSSRIIIGWEQQIVIPLGQPGTGMFDLCITAADASSGAPQSAYIRGIRTAYHQGN